MNLIRFARLGIAAGVVALLTACAHPISLEANKLPSAQNASVNKKVAYVITDADRALEVETPGGGGDKVKYYPYRDMEKAIRAALRSVYTDVAVVKTPAEATGAAYVFTPTITTTSSSQSSFTWPPTQFSAEILCTVVNPTGAPVSAVSVTGNGAAEFSEFKSEHSLSARRAVEDAAAKLAVAVRNDPKLR